MMTTEDVLERAETWLSDASREDPIAMIEALAAEVRELRRFRDWVSKRERAKWEEFRAAMEAER